MVVAELVGTTSTRTSGSVLLRERVRSWRTTEEALSNVWCVVRTCSVSVARADLERTRFAMK